MKRKSPVKTHSHKYNLLIDYLTKSNGPDSSKVTSQNWPIQAKQLCLPLHEKKGKSDFFNLQPLSFFKPATREEPLQIQQQICVAHAVNWGLFFTETDHLCSHPFKLKTTLPMIINLLVNYKPHHMTHHMNCSPIQGATLLITHTWLCILLI